MWLFLECLLLCLGKWRWHFGVAEVARWRWHSEMVEIVRWSLHTEVVEGGKRRRHSDVAGRVRWSSHTGVVESVSTVAVFEGVSRPSGRCRCSPVAAAGTTRHLRAEHRDATVIIGT